MRSCSNYNITTRAYGIWNVTKTVDYYKRSTLRIAVHIYLVYRINSFNAYDSLKMVRLHFKPLNKTNGFLNASEVSVCDDLMSLCFEFNLSR